jgi:hypothetical protein
MATEILTKVLINMDMSQVLAERLVKTIPFFHCKTEAGALVETSMAYHKISILKSMMLSATILVERGKEALGLTRSTQMRNTLSEICTLRMINNTILCQEVKVNNSLLEMVINGAEPSQSCATMMPTCFFLKDLISKVRLTRSCLALIAIQNLF